jgi:hypothetical protein
VGQIHEEQLNTKKVNKEMIERFAAAGVKVKESQTT